MNKIITYSFQEDIIENIADFIQKEYINHEKDLSRLAVVFGGKRPALFLKRALSKRIKTSFYPPRIFTIDEFMGFTVSLKEDFRQAPDMDTCFSLYHLARKHTPEILNGRESFSQFLPWTREILKFIENLDLEQVEDSALKAIGANAQIGYDVPEDINRLLQSIIRLRKAYHEELENKKIYSRGFQYRRAAQVVDDAAFDAFDEILFCNFFYFHATEERLIKSLYGRDKAVMILQGDQRKWPVLERIGRRFNCKVSEGEELAKPVFNLKLYAGFDAHSQVCTIREILKSIKQLSSTVIVLPDADNIIPLLSEISGLIDDFNISMGYPLKRSSLFSLFQFIFKAQLSMKQSRYYTKDYLKALRHPFVKNLKIAGEPAATRTLIHKIEELLTGKEKSPISGSIYVDLEEIEASEELYIFTLEMLGRMEISSTRDDLETIIGRIHELIFRKWQDVRSFFSFASVLEHCLEVLITTSNLKNYPLNINIATKMLAVKDEFKHAAFKDEAFEREDLFKIFEGKIDREMVSFMGSPLKGLQILGLFETRSLNFENVIIMDVNEGSLPRLSIYEPLIPREVMISLNLDRLELEEEIQRYQFMRLISSAKNVHLIYQESKEKERSRFIEELIWEEQKEQRAMNVFQITRPSFQVKTTQPDRSVKKTPEIIAHLKSMRYSASSINTYLHDPMEFYQNYCLGLKEQDDLLDEPEARHVGTFVHELLEHSFTPFVNKTPKIDRKFRSRFKDDFEKRFEEKFGRAMKSDSFLLKSVLQERLTRFLDNEQDNPERSVEKILHLESRFEDTIHLSCGKIRFQYIVDRIDQMRDGSVCILDYKTGSTDVMPKSVDRIEAMALSREEVLDNVRSFQIPLYFHYLDKNFRNKPINAALYNLRTLKVMKFVDAKNFYSREQINRAFLRALDYIVSEIFDPKVDFKAS